MARPSILTGATLLTLGPVAAIGAALSTAGMSQSERTHTGRSHTTGRRQCPSCIFIRLPFEEGRRGTRMTRREKKQLGGRWLVLGGRYSQGPRVPRCADTLSCLVVAGGAIEALARELAQFAVVTLLTRLLTTPALVAVRTDTGPCDGVTLGDRKSTRLNSSHL